MNLPEGIRVFERGWLSANNILLVDDQRAVLVDSGYWTHAAQTVALVEHALAGRRLDYLLNTHLHSDHCGGNRALQERYPEASTFVPPGLAQAVADWDPVALTYEPTGQHCPRFKLDGVLNPGATLSLAGREWQVHAAPGHDAHAVILFEPRDRVLISADALWQTGFGVVFQELEGDRAFEEVGETLAMIEGLSPSLVIPGHGTVFSDVASALRAARQRLETFIKDPRKHASHGVKVLLKFRLLEVQRMEWSELLHWCAVTPYFDLVHSRYFAEVGFSSWIDELIEGLVRAGAARRSDGSILNI